MISTNSGRTITRRSSPLPLTRTVPVSNQRTPSSSAISRGVFVVPRYELELVRAITMRSRTPVSLLRISSVMPSVRYTSSLSP